MNFKEKIKMKVLYATLLSLISKLPVPMQAKYLQLARDNRGSVQMVIALIVTIAVLVIGVYILAVFQTAIPNISDPVANQTATAIMSAGWSAFGLAVIIPIIVVAGAIIGYLVRGFSGGTR
jgi:hypothetical protein